MLHRFGFWLSGVFARIVPDPFVLAVLLTALTVALALAVPRMPLPDVVAAWSGEAGLWSLLRFAMQMCLILVTGHAVASSPPVARALGRIAGWPRTGAAGAALIAAVACLTGVLNWGLGLIAGAILARRVGVSLAERGIAAHYPVLVASGYLGLLVWHGGFSGSAPLKVTSPAELADIFGAAPPIAPITLEQTILGPMNLLVTGGLLLILPLVMYLVHPSDPNRMQPMPAGALGPGPSTPAPDAAKSAWLRLLEDTPAVNLLLAGLILFWALGYYLPGEGASGLWTLTPDTVNLTMLLLALLLHRSPASFLAAVEDGARGCAGIIIQFPLYAGIMGVMAASGLTVFLAERIAGIAGSGGLPVFTLASAAVVNLFVPSGGGQWAIQGPIAVKAAVTSGVEPAAMVMAVAYGDQLTNMLQPFWALPLLAITGVKARDIVGYTAVAMLVAGGWMVLGLLLWR